MKQTSNAIKFLMAQYRAIFKSAYFKGLATAVVTVGLAAAAAPANAVSITEINNADGTEFVVDDGLLDIQNKATVTEGTINKDLIIDNGKRDNIIGASGANYNLNGKGLTVENGSRLSIGFTNDNSGKGFQLKADFDSITIAEGARLDVSAAAFSSSSGGTYDIKADRIDIHGEVFLNQASGDSTSNARAANAILRADVINVSGSGASATIGDPEVADRGAYRGVLGWRATMRDNGQFMNDGSVITVSDGATINMFGVGDAGKPAGHHAQIWGKSLDMSNSNLIVSGSSNATFGSGGGGILQLTDISLTNNYIEIADNSTLSLQLRAGNQKNASAGNSLYDQTNGTATISGGTVVIDGTLRMTTGGTLTIAEGTNLTAGSTSKNEKRDNAIFIGAINPTSNQGIAQSFEGSTLPTLNIASSTLDSFLNKADEELVDLDGKPVADYRGQLNLTFGAHVNFTDDTTVEMTAFTFANEAGAGNIVLDKQYTDDSGSGSIGVGDGKKDGNIEIFAKNMSVASSMLADTSATNVDKMSANSSLGIDFKANVLTLGSNDRVENGQTVYGYDSSATYGLGARSFTAFDQVHFIDGTGQTFHLKDDLTLTRDYYTKDENGDYTTTLNSGGTIHGDNISIEADKTLTVSGGAWSNANSQILTIASGSLAVTASAYDRDGKKGITEDDALTDANGESYYVNGNPSSLTWNGVFEINGESVVNDAEITVTGAQGADALLDLTNANVKWGSGSITLSGNEERNNATDVEAMAGEGILKIDGNQFKTFLDSSSKTQLSIDDSGLLYVEGTVSGPINFSKFTSGGPAANTVNFTGAGTLYTTGALSLVTGVNSAGAKLDLGSGSIYAQSITINNHSSTIKDKNDPTLNVVEVQDGTLGVSQSLISSNQTIVFGDGADNANLELSSDDNSTGGTVSSHLLFKSGSQFAVEQGQWSLGDGRDVEIAAGSMTVGDINYDRTADTAALTVDNLAFTENSAATDELQVFEGSSLSVNTLQAASGSTLIVNGVLTVAGKAEADIDTGSKSYEPDSLQKAAKTAGINLEDVTVLVKGNNAKFELGSVATSTLVTLGDKENDRVQINDALDKANIEVDDYASIKLNFASGTLIDADTARELKEELTLDLNNQGNTGWINVGQADLAIKYTDEANLVTTWDNVKDFANVESDVANTKLLNTLVTDIDAGDVVRGHYGAIQTNFDNKTLLQVNGTLGLHNARRDGYFVSHKNADGSLEAIGVSLQGDSNLLLVGTGKVGKITGFVDTASEVSFAASTTESGEVVTTDLIEVLGGIQNVGEVDVGSLNVKVSGAIVADYADVRGNLDNAGYDSTYENAHVWAGGSLNTKNLTLTGADSDDIPSYFNGTVTVEDKLSVGYGADSHNLYVASGMVTANQLVLTSGSMVQVGWEAQAADDVETEYFNEAQSYSGRMLVQTADLNGGSIVTDPESGLQTAIMGINKFAGASTTNGTDLGSIDGSLYVGRNSVQALGADDWAEIESAIAPYATNGVLTSYGAMMYLDGTTSLTSGDGIVMTAQSIKDFTTYIANETKLGALDADSHTLANTVYFGANTALLVTADAMDAAATDRGNTALVTFADGNGQLVADGGEILVAGDVRATNYTLFTDTDGKVAVVDNQGALTTAENGITVTTENGFLVGTLSGENGGNVTLTVSRDGRSVMSGASDPVYTTLVAYAKGYNGVETTDEATGTKSADYLTNGYVTNADGTVVTDENGNPVKNRTYSNELLQNVISTGNGRDAETVARLGMLGGVAQSAMAAGASTYDAIAGRMGVGSSMGNVTIANNTQGASLWLTPIYKNSESDGFEADNLDYGVDIDLYGVALGADFTMQNGVRVGAMFNVGSGDADGNGAGSAVSNDFDYYGFGVYAGYTYGAFSVLADVTYTVADNDVEGSTSLGQVSTSLDSTNLSVGVTGQYNLNLGGVDVTPHAGLRFSSIDIDDYDVADIASYDADSLNIFSIPVGVTFAKEFQGEAWTWKPSLDITVQGNFGDDSADGTVAWAGIDNLKTELSSEVIDNFTYGATLGVAAQTGNFSMGLGINYTGSSNVDDYGVSANARFVF